jgi:hypothetical protein
MPQVNKPRVETIFGGNFLSYSGQREDFTLPPPAPQELVSPDGQCADTAAGDPTADQMTPGLPSGGVALQMTECEVVRRVGLPERVELGATERGDRAAVLTYTQGARPGIYRFAGGRLYAIERAPEPAPAPRQPRTAAKKRT